MHVPVHVITKRVLFGLVWTAYLIYTVHQFSNSFADDERRCHVFYSGEDERKVSLPMILTHYDSSAGYRSPTSLRFDFRFVNWTKVSWGGPFSFLFFSWWKKSAAEFELTNVVRGRAQVGNWMAQIAHFLPKCCPLDSRKSWRPKHERIQVMRNYHSTRELVGHNSCPFAAHLQ